MLNVIRRWLGLPTITWAERDSEDRVIIDPDEHTRLHV